MRISGTDVLIDEYAVARQLAQTVAAAGRAAQEFVNPFSSVRSASRPQAPAESGSTSLEMEPRGDHRFNAGDDYIEIGESGVRIKVEDLAVASENTEVILDGRRYFTGSFYEQARLVVEGSDGVDKISIAQDEEGNTIVEVSRNGVTDSVNAGAIAAVSVRLGAGNDVISIKAENYFGGVDLEGGSGDDSIDADISYALKAGIALNGGAGDDRMTVKGLYSGLTVEGAEGDDWIDAGGLEGGTLFRYLSGGDGADLIFSGTGGEVHGGAGADLLSADGGSVRLYGGEGNDVIYGGRDKDKIYGESGADIISGGAGDDFVDGGDDDDLIMGGAGSDWLVGGAGNDAVYGGGFMGEDFARLQAGTVEIPYCFEFLTGGSGVDSFWPSSVSPSNTTAYTGAGAAVLDYESGVDVIA